MFVRRVLTALLLVCVAVLVVWMCEPRSGWAQGDGPNRTDALVLVNSASASYGDFESRVQPYLDNFGVPYTVLDIASSQLPSTLGDYSLLIIGHRQIDVGGQYLSSDEQAAIVDAVQGGTGLVNFDNDLWTGSGAARYTFVQSVFGFGRGGSTQGSDVSFDSSPVTGGYITQLHPATEIVSTGTTRLAGITLPASASAVAYCGDEPLVVATNLGMGKAVQWGSYDWMSPSVLGPIAGLDDLMWRSLVWAAHKPFVLQALRPIVTMRVDDEIGPFDWIHTANAVGFKPWVGIDFQQVSNSDAADLSALVNAGQATAGIHAFSYLASDTPDGTFFYYHHAVNADFSASTVAANFATANQWLQQHNIPIAKFALPHYYEFGTNVFGYLRDWGVEFVGTVLKPGQPYNGGVWLQSGPYRRSESGSSESTRPLYYADFLQVPGHPEYDGQFFNCVTEIRDDLGYEWYPTNDVADTVDHGTLQLERAFDSRALGTLFTHVDNIHLNQTNWLSILQGIKANIAGYDPQYLTMDAASRYVRALSTSKISGGTYDATAQSAVTTLSGSTDVTTQVSLFTANGDQITERLVDVPAFIGQTTITTDVGSGTGDVTPPQISAVTAGQVTASGATVTWTTDEPADSQIEYGSTNAYGSTTTRDTSLTTSHSQALTGLSPSTLYHYRVISRDGSGNLSQSPDATFTTAAAPAVSLSITDVSVTEGNSGSANAVFTVSLSAASGQTVTVAYATANGTATAGSDYTAKTGTLTFAAGVTSQTVSVAVTGDTAAEANETFTVNLSGASNATIVDAQGVGTIVDDDTAATAVTINCWDDAHQSPVLTTTTNASNISLTDGAWTEFLYSGGRSFPTVCAGASEYETYGLPAMRFYTSGLANGTWDVYANLYTNETGRNMRYYWGYSATDTKHYSIDTVGGSGGSTEHTEYRLGAVTITDGTFSLYAQDADMLSGSYAVFGWAWVRLVKTSADVTPPQISAVTAGQVTASGATVTWTTDEPADSQIEYGPTNAYGSTTTRDTSLTTSHSQALTGLSPSTLYHYRVISRDGSGNLSQSPDATFTTAAAPAVSLSITDVSVTEGNSGSANAVFTVSLSAASGQTVTVAYATADGTATAGSDYTAKTGTLSFAAGVTSQTVSVAVTGDTRDEPDETFLVNLSSAVNATIADAQGVGTIVDNDATPSLAITDVSVTEGNSGSANAVFTVSLSAASGQAVSVAYATANGTATAGSDYTAKTGTLSFAAGVTSQTVSVAVTGDTAAEANETFTVNLSGASNATIVDAQGVGTIVDDDALPSLSIGDVSIVEGDSGTANAVFTVSLSAASPLAVSAAYATANGTATAGSDYAAASGTLVFPAGVTSQTVSVAVTGDTRDEPDETFTVNLSGASNATIVDAQGVGTIVDNDATPSLAITDVSVTEGNSGSANAVFTVSLSAASGQTVTVAYATANGTATAGSDYTAKTGTLTFAAGVTSQTVSVAVTGDTRDEPDETFLVNLSSAVNATLADNQGVGTIVDNDATPSLAITDVSVTEGNSGSANAVFTVSLSAASGQTVTVAYATANGTATAGSDYTAKTGTLTFAAGVTSQTVSVAVTGDTAAEANETFTVNLSGASNATIVDAQGVGTIVDDDTAATAVTINCWDDAHQSPVLTTTTNASNISLTDGAWTEFLYSGGRSFPTVCAGASEYETYGLPAMRFYTSGLANGTWDVYANLYTNETGRNMRYYWGYSATDTKHYSIDTVGGSGGSTEHTEYRLGSVTITDGTFSLYAQDADMLNGSYAVFGWAWVRLVKTS